MNSNEIPVKKLTDVEEKEKYSLVLFKYQKEFDSKPKFFVRCPGRINIIGKHVDYNGFPVLPIAIEKDLIIGVGPSGNNKINITNTDDSTYPKFSDVFENITIDNQKYNWYDSILCGILGISDRYQLKSVTCNLIVHFDINRESGLSSSSALVCAGALAVANYYNIHLGKIELAELCASAQRRVGKQGGNMNQAIIFLAEEGGAKKIEFNPLRATTIVLPDNLKLVVAHSGVQLNRATSIKAFNKRVVECMLAAKVLAKYLKLDWEIVNNLGTLPLLLYEGSDISLLKKMLSLVSKYLDKKVYTRQEICQILDIDDAKLQAILQEFQLCHCEDLNDFNLADRANHVYKEAANVEEFIQCCDSKNFKGIGEVLSKSHKSLRDLFECSHKKLDDIVEIANNFGALGSHLTGPGWGGCVITIVEEKKLVQVVMALQAHAVQEGLNPHSVFITKPRQGATIIEVIER